ncbi:MAG: MaoC family dehydratase N-terminal domain-containing protein [Chloroflexota bacterium]
MLFENAPITRQGLKHLRARTGIELRIHPHNTQVTLDGIRHFVRSIGDPNPLWSDPGYAARSPYGSIVAPPSYLYTIVHPSGALAGGLPGVHSLLGGNDWEFHRPLLLGDRIHARARLVDVAEKASAFAGRAIVVTTETDYFNQRQELVAHARGWSFRVQRGAVIASGKYKAYKPPQYTAEEVRAIEDSCLAEQARGAAPRYWEDTTEGESLGSVVKGPLTFEDAEAYVASTLGLPAYARLTDKIDRHPAWACKNPATGLPEPVTRVNFYDYAAQAVGMPRAYDLGSQRICWLIHLLTNWAGDTGTLTRLRVDLRLPNFHGDTTWCTGAVERKYVKDDRHLVECAVRCENQRQETTATGQAIIALSSRQVQRQSCRSPSFSSLRRI